MSEQKATRYTWARKGRADRDGEDPARWYQRRNVYMSYLKSASPVVVRLLGGVLPSQHRKGTEYIELQVLGDREADGEHRTYYLQVEGDQPKDLLNAAPLDDWLTATVEGGGDRENPDPGSFKLTLDPYTGAVPGERQLPGTGTIMGDQRLAMMYAATLVDEVRTGAGLPGLSDDTMLTCIKEIAAGMLIRWEKVRYRKPLGDSDPVVVEQPQAAPDTTSQVAPQPADADLMAEVANKAAGGVTAGWLDQGTYDQINTALGKGVSAASAQNTLSKLVAMESEATVEAGVATGGDDDLPW